LEEREGTQGFDSVLLLVVVKTCAVPCIYDSQLNLLEEGEGT